MNTKKEQPYGMALKKQKKRGVGAESSMCSYASFSCIAVK